MARWDLRKLRLLRPLIATLYAKEMNGRIPLLLAALICTGTSAAESWSLNPKFTIEGSDYRETLIFISGFAYALTYSASATKQSGSGNDFCLPEGEMVTSKLVISLVNEDLAGIQSPEHVSATAVAKLRERYPCPQ